MSPTISTKKTKEPKRAVKSRMAMEREKVILLGAIIACAATILIHLLIQVVGAVQFHGKVKQELQALKNTRMLQVNENQAKFEQELELAKRAQGENLAGKHRDEEFARRQRLDPAFGRSETEKAMLKMKAIGEDAELAPADAVKKIAKLACPPGSGIGVYPENNGIRVEIAFPYKAVVDAHPDLLNYLPGYYYEVQKMAAGIMKDVFAFGAGRGISGLTITCQNLERVKKQGTTTREIRDLFIVYGSPGGRDWLRLSRPEIENVWNKRRDQFPALLKGF
ncbi:MAG TPA: hypothetical protein VM658_06635 [bacterium]|nr:hypothetical protein [bacterium]